MSSNVIALNDGNFSEAVASGVTLIDFWAPWCRPCLMQGTIIEQVARKIKGRVRVAKVNVDESKQIALQYCIQSIPTIMILKDGLVTEQMIGVHSEMQLISAINQSL